MLKKVISEYKVIVIITILIILVIFTGSLRDHIDYHRKHKTIEDYIYAYVHEKAKILSEHSINDNIKIVIAKIPYNSENELDNAIGLYLFENTKHGWEKIFSDWLYIQDVHLSGRWKYADTSIIQIKSWLLYWGIAGKDVDYVVFNYGDYNMNVKIPETNTYQVFCFPVIIKPHENYFPRKDRSVILKSGKIVPYPFTIDKAI